MIKRSKLKLYSQELICSYNALPQCRGSVLVKIKKYESKARQTIGNTEDNSRELV